jgi:DNA-damage-inducible protein J
MGIDLSTAIRIFFKKSLAEGGIPFSMNTSEKQQNNSAGIEAFGKLRQQAKANGLADLSLDQINAEISAARAERKR